jgi:dihydroorotase-like cyclic amidohydrolase
MYDLSITGGTVATSSGIYKADIGISEGRIRTISKTIKADNSEKTINAAGKYIFPGIWHTHCHFRDPGLPIKEDFESGSRCAAAGGITFVIDMTNNTPMPTTPKDFLAKKANAESKSIVDFGLYGGGLYPEQVKPLVD